MRVLVCGGRAYANRKLVYATLDTLEKEAGEPLEIIEGGARGADRLAANWAAVHMRWVNTCHADWSRNGRRAGPIRNAQMLRDHNPDLVVAFPGGAGTADMVRKAKAAGVKVMEIADA